MPQAILYKKTGDIPYGYCNGGTLNKFDFAFTFPFYTVTENPNSPSCSATPHVCDLTSADPSPKVVKPNTITSNDGSISWTVTTGGGTVIAYSLVDVPYGQMTNTSGIFTGLGLGFYTVYARDPYNCLLKSTVVIDAPLVAGVNNGVLYRQEYKDLKLVQSRIDILKRDYVGAITEVKGSSEPFVLRLRGENGNFFDAVLASEATQNLVSQTNFQFLGLYTEDDRMYQVIFYKDLGSGLVEQWRGFINPVLYGEKYDRDTNYYVSVLSTDQLTTLKNSYFLDSAGNTISGNVSLIHIIATILLKTDLLLPIRVAINIFDSGMSTGAADDPLTQADINASTYDGMTCWDVLKDVIGSFGANIFQWGGYWHIRRRGETTGSYAYRQYTFAGVYTSNSTTDPRTSAWNWEGRSQNLLMVGSKGIVSITHNLIKNESYFRNGGFEETIGFTEQIPGYTIVMNGNAAGLTRVSGNQSIAALKVFSNSVNTTYGEDAYVVAGEKPLIIAPSDYVKISLDFFPDVLQGTRVAKFVKFKVSLKVGSYYLQSDSSWSTSNQWIELTVQDTDFNTWGNLEFIAISPYTVLTTTTVQVRVMHGSAMGRCWYYVSGGDLKTVATAGVLSQGYRANVYFETVQPDLLHYTTTIRYYELRIGTDAESSPTILRPTDFNAVTNPVIWVLTDTQYGYKDYSEIYNVKTLNGTSGFIRIFDNLRFDVLPGGSDLPTNKIYYFQSSTRNKNNITAEFLTGDSPVEITNGAYSYINPLKLSNGTLTRLWKRTSNDTESLPLLSLLAKQMAEQLFVPKFKLTGTIRQSSFFGFDAVPVEYSKNYALAGMSIMDFGCHSQVEMYEITEELGEDVLDEFNSEEFSTEIGFSRSS